MVCTVKKLSMLSGVTVRTLHFYEEANLLKPAYYGSNGYRYYKEPELLKLQQILFFKKLGFSLKEIRKVLGESDFNQMAALRSHRKTLLHEREKIEQLIETIDKTINHAKGRSTMKAREFFTGFSTIKKGTGSEPYFISEELVLEATKYSVHSKKEGLSHEMINGMANDIYSQITDCIEKNLGPDSSEVQFLIQQHYLLTEQVHPAGKEVYQALGVLYQEHPTFRKQLDPIHPELAVFLGIAMKRFAEVNF